MTRQAGGLEAAAAEYQLGAGSQHPPNLILDALGRLPRDQRPKIGGSLERIVDVQESDALMHALGKLGGDEAIDEDMPGRGEHLAAVAQALPHDAGYRHVEVGIATDNEGIRGGGFREQLPRGGSVLDEPVGRLLAAADDVECARGQALERLRESEARERIAGGRQQHQRRARGESGRSRGAEREQREIPRQECAHRTGRDAASRLRQRARDAGFRPPANGTRAGERPPALKHERRGLDAIEGFA